MKKLILLFVSLILSISLVACGECEHIDENNDGVCDLCEYNYDHEHTYDEEWTYNDTEHWHNVTCTHTVEDGDKGEHTDEDNDGVCDGCSWDYDHEHTYEALWSHDNENHWHAVSCTHSVEVKDKGEHTDENNDGICDGCLWNYDHTHTYEEKWTYDKDSHWQAPACSHEIEIINKAPHTDSNADGSCDICNMPSEEEEPPKAPDIEYPEIEF